MKWFLVLALILMATNARAQATAHIGIEMWTATDQGGGEGAAWNYVIGNGGDIHLFGIYGNAALDNAVPDANDREFLFSVSSRSPGVAMAETSAFMPSHHGIDPSLYAGILKQAGTNNATVPVNMAFPGGGIIVPNGAIRIGAVTGVYSPGSSYSAVSCGNTACMSAELHLTFVFTQ